MAAGEYTSSLLWEYVTVRLRRTPGFGFGIAVSGGNDNPHFASGDKSIAISDVLKGGPAEGLLFINDRIISANGVLLQNVDYTRAISILRDSSTSEITLRIKRRKCNVRSVPVNCTSGNNKVKLEKELGIVLGTKIYVKSIKFDGATDFHVGDTLLRVNSIDIEDIVGNVTKDICKKIEENINRELKKVGSVHVDVAKDPLTLLEEEEPRTNGSSMNGNLYVQPPSRHTRSASYQSNEGHSAPGRQKTLDFWVAKPVSLSTPLGLRLLDDGLEGVHIAAVQSGTPAWKTGLIAGDRVVKINNSTFSYKDEVISFLQTIHPGEKIKITVFRDDNGQQQHPATPFLNGTINHGVKNGENEVSTLSTPPTAHSSSLSRQKKLEESYYLCNFSHEPEFRKNDIIKVIRREAEYFITDKGQRIPGQSLSKEILLRQQRDKNHWFGGFNLYDTIEDIQQGGRIHRWTMRRRTDRVSEPYTKVSFKKVDSKRPVVIYGPVATYVISKLANLYSSLFEKIQETNSENGPYYNLVDLTSIITKAKFALIEVSPQSIIDLKLRNDLHPISIYVDLDSKKTIKKISSGSSLKRSKSFVNIIYSNRNKFEAWSKFHKKYEGIFDATVKIDDNLEEAWKTIINGIESVQGKSVWASYMGDNENSMEAGYNSMKPLLQIPVFRTLGQCADADSTERSSQMETSLPNYNLPCPQSTDDFEPYSFQAYQKLDGIATSSRQSRIHDLSASVSRSSGTPESKSGGLAHSPEPPPKVDRTKKPKKSDKSAYKPVPPPKPSKLKAWGKLSNSAEYDPDNYYLNVSGIAGNKLSSNRSSSRLNSSISNNNNHSKDLTLHDKNSSSSPGPKVISLEDTYPHQYNTSYVTRGTIGPSGGIIRQAVYPCGYVELDVPEGALEKETELWFQVLKQVELCSDLSSNILSPLVKFGPEGLVFQKTVEIRMPQFGREFGSVLMSNSSQQEWREVKINNGGDLSCFMNMVALTVAHF